MESSQYGAAIDRRDYIRVSLAAGVGSVLEWYDYTVLIAMSPVIQQAFFPKGDLAAKQLSFWSVYAVGYIFRPLGSLLFGHICDVHGRRLSLMITLIMMAIPTVLIGCLPTYAQAGLAAPIILSLLRLVQGIAVGGELGTAVVFMHELAPAGSKTKGGSIIFIGVTAGILMGIIMSMIVNAAIPPDALLHWGWRIPFLIAILTAVLGLLLRYKMPESFEFEEDPIKAAHRQRLQQQTFKGSSSGVHQQSSQAATRDRSSSSSTQQQQQQQPDGRLKQGGVVVDCTPAGDLASSKDVLGSDKDSTRLQQSASTQQQDQHEQQQQQQEQQQQQQQHTAVAAWQGRGCSWLLGHEPVRVMFRDHWREVMLLFWFETWSAANFYVFYGWLPSYIAAEWKVPTELTLGMTLVNMSMTLALIPAAAHLADRGLPRLAATCAILVTAGLTSVPMMLAVSSRSMVAAWLMQMCDLFMNASIFGWLPTIGSLLFPVHVRATGYNFAHTAAQSWLGGLTPLIISGINLRLQRSTAMTGAIYLVTGVYLTLCAAVSLVALWIMWRMFPQTNRDPPSAAKAKSHLPVSNTANSSSSGDCSGSGVGVAAGAASTA